jgi:hypothetical protein
MAERKPILLRLDPAVYDALARWAGDELRSTNAQIEMVLRRALTEAGRHPAQVSPLRRPGRPRKNSDTSGAADTPGAADAASVPEPASAPDAVSTADSQETS